MLIYYYLSLLEATKRENMTEPEVSTKIKPVGSDCNSKATIGRLFVLDLVTAMSSHWLQPSRKVI
jgi:hypothetical protein